MSEEIVMWKKKHLDMEEQCQDLHVEIKRLRRQCEEYKELQDMDADEDAVREHKLKKAKHHLHELEKKYHALEKEYQALLKWKAMYAEMEGKVTTLTEQCKHLDEEVHMWEEKFHKMEKKYHDAYGKIAMFKKQMTELEAK